MKCPKCGYLGFEQAERCRNCGYTFSLSQAPSEGETDLPLRQGEVLGPLGDFDLGDGVPPSRGLSRSRRRNEPLPDPDELGPIPAPSPAPSALPTDLPLFGGEGTDEDLPLIRPSAPIAPLAVRRGAAPAPRAPRARLTPRFVEEGAVATLPLPEPAERSREVDPEAGSAGASDSDVPVRVRLFAGLIDWAVLLAVDLVVVYFTLRVSRLDAAEVWLLPLLPLGLFFLCLNGGYFSLFTVASGQTMGKMAFGLKVVDEQGRRLSLGRSLLRTATMLLCTVPAGLGLLPIAFGSHRGLHDLLARTHVVRAATE